MHVYLLYAVCSYAARSSITPIAILYIILLYPPVPLIELVSYYYIS